MRLRMEKGTANKVVPFFVQKGDKVTWERGVTVKALFLKEKMGDGAGHILMNSIIGIMFMEKVRLRQKRS